MFDDRLATVLRTRALGLAGQRTQFRQLLDLLGTIREGRSAEGQIESAFARLEELRAQISPKEQEQILRESGLRLRNPRLIALLAAGEPRAAAAAMANARLDEREWLALIPSLPVGARGFLRHRRDLPASANDLLARLGVGDLVLSDDAHQQRAPANPVPPARERAEPVEDVVPTEPEATPEPFTAAIPLEATSSSDLETVLFAPAIAEQPSIPAPVAATAEPRAIGDIIERIETYRSARRAPVLAPRLPLGDSPSSEASASVLAFDVVTDAEGRVVAASDPVAPELVGMLLTGAHPGALVSYGAGLQGALRRHQPVHDGLIVLNSHSRLSGDWQLEAVPVFERPRGNFSGYRCRLRRPLRVERPAAPTPENAQANRMREILHELRTPVGAIQGFAEVIQQQMFGPAPHEYRAHAAAITVDAARLLAGFDELERMARLETGAAQLEQGECDLAEVLAATLRRLEPALSPREAKIELVKTGSVFPLPFARHEMLLFAWRLLASLAGALAPSEILPLKLERSGGSALLGCTLPASLVPVLRGDEAAGSKRKGALSAGMFGPCFAFDLAAVEARAAGGRLEVRGEKLELHLPLTDGALLNGKASPNSPR